MSSAAKPIAAAMDDCVETPAVFAAPVFNGAQAASAAFTAYRDTPKANPKSDVAEWNRKMKAMMDNAAKSNGKLDAAADRMIQALGATDLASCIASFNNLKITAQAAGAKKG